MALSMACMLGLLAAGPSSAQEPTVVGGDPLSTSVAALVQSASQRDAASLQTYHLTRFVRQLEAHVVRSMDGASGARSFPGTPAVLDLTDVIATIDTAGPSDAPLDVGVMQGIREVASWYDLASWSRSPHGTCVDSSAEAFESRLEATRSWWSDRTRQNVARALVHALAIFYERAGWQRGAPTSAAHVCLAENRTEVIRLRLDRFVPHVTLSAEPGRTDPRSQADLTWTLRPPARRPLEVLQSEATSGIWTVADTVPEQRGGISIDGLRPGVTYHFRVGPVGSPERDLSNVATVTLRESGCQRWWCRPRVVLPAVGALVGGILLLTRDDEDSAPRNGTVIVRIPLG